MCNLSFSSAFWTLSIAFLVILESISPILHKALFWVNNLVTFSLIWKFLFAKTSLVFTSKHIWYKFYCFRRPEIKCWTTASLLEKQFLERSNHSMCCMVLFNKFAIYKQAIFPMLFIDRFIFFMFVKLNRIVSSSV